jgi:hypothetical protein
MILIVALRIHATRLVFEFHIHEGASLFLVFRCVGAYHLDSRSENKQPALELSEVLCPNLHLVNSAQVGFMPLSVCDSACSTFVSSKQQLPQLFDCPSVSSVMEDTQAFHDEDGGYGSDVSLGGLDEGTQEHVVDEPVTPAKLGPDPTVHDVIDLTSLGPRRDSWLVPSSPAYHWAGKLLPFFDAKRAALGCQTRKIKVLSMCTGMFCEGLTMEVHTEANGHPFLAN